jgi:hypothetical protein
MPEPEKKYCLDSSALLELRSLDADVFRGIWDAMNELATKGIIHAPREVLREVTHYDTATATWAKSRKAIFFDPDQTLLDKVVEIQSEFSFFDPDSEIPKADPFLVAHSALTGCTIVTMEVPHKPGRSEAKIPDACKRFGGKVITLSEFFREQGYTFIGQKKLRPQVSS